jgi:tetratricopeptide (TPR) repeat protein
MKSQTVQAAWSRLGAPDPQTHFDGVVALLCDEAQTAQGATRAGLLADAAQISQQGLGDDAQAGTLWREAHDADPVNPRALEGLAGLAERAEDWAAATRWLEAAWREATAGSAAWLALARRLLVAAQDHLRDAELARRVLDAALAQAPDDLDLLIRRQLLVADGPAARTAFDERWLVLSEGSTRRGALLLARGHRRLSEEDLTGARAAFEAALEADPNSAPARLALVRVLTQAQAWPELVERLEAVVAQAPAGPERGRAAYVAAMYADGRLHDSARAQPLFATAVAELAHDPVAARELVRWSGDATGVALVEQLAVWAADPDPAEGAVGAYLLGLAAERAGDEARAAHAHGDALHLGGLLLAAAAMRRRAGGGETAFKATTALYDSAEEASARVSLATQAGQLALLAGEFAQADAWFERALSETPADTGTVPAAMHGRWAAHAAEARWPALADRLSEWLSGDHAPSVMRWAHQSLGTLALAHLGDVDLGVAQARACLELAPEDRWARGVIARQSHGPSAPIEAEMLCGLAGAVRGVERAAWFVRAGDQLAAGGDLDAAEGHWRSALEVDGTFLPALSRLGPALAHGGRQDEVSALYAAELSGLPADRARRAEVASYMACEALREASDDTELQIDAFEAWRAVDSDAALALDGLVALYAAEGRHADLAAVLQRRAGWLGAPLAATDQLRAGLALLAAGDHPGASKVFAELGSVGVDPIAGVVAEYAALQLDDGPLLESTLSALADGEAPDVALVAEHKRAALGGVSGQAALAGLAARGDLGAAWTQLRLSAEARDVPAQIDAAEALAHALGASTDAWAVRCLAGSLAARAGLSADRRGTLWEAALRGAPGCQRGWAGLVAARAEDDAEASAVWVRYARQTSSPRARSAALWQAALLEESRGQSDLAETLFDEAISADPDDITALWLRYDPAPRDAQTRIDLLVALAGRLRPARDQARALYEAGVIARDAMGSDPGVFLVEAARRDPSSERMADEVMGMLRAQSRYAELAEVLAARVQRTTGAQKIALLRTLADVQLDRLRDRAAARSTWLEVAALEPNDGDAWACLGDLCFGLEAFGEAVEHYRRALDLEPDPPEAARIHLRIGRLLARQLGVAEGAIHHLEEAGRIHDPQHQAREALAEVLLTNGQPERAAEIYRLLAEQDAAPGARAGLVRALMTAGRLPEAVAHLRQFREEDSADPLLMALEQALEASGAFEPEPEPELEPAELDLAGLALDLELAESELAAPESELAAPESEPTAPELEPVEAALAEAEPALELPEPSGVELASVAPEPQAELDADPLDASELSWDLDDDVVPLTAALDARVPVLAPSDSLDEWTVTTPEERPQASGPPPLPPFESNAAEASVDELGAVLGALDGALMGTLNDSASGIELQTVDALSPILPDAASEEHAAEQHVEPGDASELPDADLVSGEPLEVPLEPLALDLGSLEPSLSEPDALALSEPDALEPLRLGPDDLEPSLSEPDALEPLRLGPDDLEPSLSEPDALDPQALYPLTLDLVDGGGRAEEAPSEELQAALQALSVAPVAFEGAALADIQPNLGPPLDLSTPPPDLGLALGGQPLKVPEVSAFPAVVEVLPGTLADALAELDFDAPKPAGSGSSRPSAGPVVARPSQRPPQVPGEPSDGLRPGEALVVEPLDLYEAAVDIGLEQNPADSVEIDPALIIGDGGFEFDAQDRAALEAASVPPATPPPVPSVARITAGPRRLEGRQAEIASARARITREPLVEAAWAHLIDVLEPGEAGLRWLKDVHAWVSGRANAQAVSAVAPTEPVPERLRRSVLPAGVAPNLFLLLRSVGPTVAPAFSPVQGRRRGGRRVPDHEPLADLVRRVARVLEVPPVQPVIDDERPYTVGVEAGEPSRLLLGSAVFEGADLGGMTFLIARELGPLREGTLPARALSDREFRAFLGALFEMLQAGYPIRARDRITVDRVRGWLDPLLAVHQRLAWEPLAQAASVGLGARSASGIRAGLEVYNARLALSVADGFAGAMEMLRLLDFDDRPRAELSTGDLAQFMGDNDIARDLLVFAGSEACLAIRQWREETGVPAS